MTDMLLKQGFVHPGEWKYPIEPSVDYRLAENRMYLVKSWAEAMYHTGELNQQLRLMDWAIENGFKTPSVIESKLWLAFLWGCCYNFTGPWLILSAFPTPPSSKHEMEVFTAWYNKNFDRIRFDTDCRYRKAKMVPCVQSYVDFLSGRTQEQAFMPILTKQGRTPFEKYTIFWDIANGWDFYGRLSSWNYLEAVALVTNWQHGLDCQDFLLTDVTGSESNRNGIAFIVDREDLVTKHGKKKSDGQPISEQECLMLNEKAEDTYQELLAEFGHIDPVLRFNVETVYCWVKKRFRERNTRYIGWDSERTIDEMDFVSEFWLPREASVDIIYAAREMWLPDYLRCEQGPRESRGQKKDKMPVFFQTGTPMDLVKFQNGERWDFSAQKATPKSATKKLW